MAEETPAPEDGATPAAAPKKKKKLVPRMLNRALGHRPPCLGCRK